MKVCYVTHLPNLTGSSQSLLDMISSVENYGVEPFVLLGRSGPLEEELKKRKIKYGIIRYSTDICENPLKNSVKKIINLIAEKKIIKLFNEEKFDIVHNNTMLVSVGMDAAKKAEIPYVSHNREMIWEDHHIKLVNENRSYELLRNSNKIIYISDYVRNKFIKIAPNTDYITVRDAISAERYIDIHERYIANKNEINILIAGRINTGKGQFDAVQAINKLNKQSEYCYKLYIVGNPSDMNYMNMMKNYIDEKHITNVRFISFTDLRELRKKCDISLVCSSNEALGRVTLESMLAGTITIGANAGATTELISDGINGFLYECSNVQDLADKILMVSGKDESELRKIADNARSYAEKEFSQDSYGKRIFDIYNELVRN